MRHRLHPKNYCPNPLDPELGTTLKHFHAGSPAANVSLTATDEHQLSPPKWIRKYFEFLLESAKKLHKFREK